MLGVDGVKFSSPYDKVCEWNFVGDVLVIIPGNNGSRTQAPGDEALYDPDGIFITEAPELITVSTGVELNADHVLYVLVGKLYFSID